MLDALAPLTICKSTTREAFKSCPVLELLMFSACTSKPHKMFSNSADACLSRSVCKQTSQAAVIDHG